MGTGPGNVGARIGTAMLANTPTNKVRIATLFLFVVVAVGLILTCLSPWSAGDPPRDVYSGKATRTVTWNLNTSNGLALHDVDLADGNATLSWKSSNITWAAPSQFVANGTLDGNLVAGASNISLRSDTSNHVADGDFTSSLPWQYSPSAGGNVTTAWDSATRSAVFRHASALTESLWDNLDAKPNLAWAGVSGTTWTNTTAQHEGAGMLGLNFSFPAAPSWAGVLHLAPVDLSGYDRLVVWVLPLNVSSPLTFNVTAFVNSTLHTTVARPLTAGWQDVAINLTQLGFSRNSLVSLTFRVNGQTVPATTIYFDDIRVGNAKRFDEAATVRQALSKANTTSSSPGSATLQFDWSLPQATGVARVTGTVNLSGPSGSTAQTFSGPSGTPWRRFVADVSGTTSAPGSYSLTIILEVILDNTSASSVQVYVDNVSLMWPNRHNGTYLSNAVPLGTPSDLFRVSWSADSSAPAAVVMALRSGNDSIPGSSSWSPWRTWTSSGSFNISLPSSSFFQARVDLKTTNASVAPFLRGMIIETRHHAAQGTILSALFSVNTLFPFLHWRTLLATSNVPPGTSISFTVGNGTDQQSVLPGSTLSSLKWTAILWSVTLATTNGLLSPSLREIQLVYDYQGPINHVTLTASRNLTVAPGSSITFTANALDEGNHVVASFPSQFVWTTDDPRGEVGGGFYTAGDTEGTYGVTATFPGTSYSATLNVTVRYTGTWTEAMVRYIPYELAILGAAAIVGAIYYLIIRRMFAIDDIFLISKDGRLLIHNTRRMRADRDEDILSGMFTAILAFLKDSDPEENGELRRFVIGGKTTLLERGTHADLVAVYSGRVPRWAQKDLRRFMDGLESRFGDAFAEWTGSPEDLQGLKAFTTKFVSRVRYRPPRGTNGRAGDQRELRSR